MPATSGPADDRPSLKPRGGPTYFEYLWAVFVFVGLLLGPAVGYRRFGLPGAVLGAPLGAVAGCALWYAAMAAVIGVIWLFDPKTRRPGEKMSVALALYRREQWERLRAVSSDPEELEATYEEWAEKSERRRRGLDEAAQTRAVAVDVDVDKLVRWCEERNCRLDAYARERFIWERLDELESKPSQG